MDKLKAMEVFVTVVDCGSQSTAAEKLDLSRPVVSRYIAELEDWIGNRLLHRTTRKLSLTAAGEELLPQCRHILDLTEDMHSTVQPTDAAPQGLLRITVSTSFANAQMARAVADFIKLYPKVSVEFLLLDRTVNLIEERIDLAIRTTNSLDPNLIARKISVCRSVICASPEYLRTHGVPQRGDDLLAHQCLTHSFHEKHTWNFDHQGQSHAYAVQSSMMANESTVMMQAAEAGAGIALLPTYLAAPAIRAGRLIPLLREYEATTLGIYAVYASRKHMPPALRAMLDFLAERFSDRPEWDNF